MMRSENHGLKVAEREQLIREAFDAFAMVGFLKWKREEIEQHGTLPDEADRAEYVEGLKRMAWPDFRDMAAQATDSRLLDLRQDWIERADGLALLDMRGELTARHVDEELRRYSDGSYPAEHVKGMDEAQADAAARAEQQELGKGRGK